MIYRYRHSGVTIDSEVELPEWDVYSFQSEEFSDVLIEKHDELGAIPILTPDARIERNRLVVDIPEAGRFTIVSGNEIWFAPQPGTGEAERRLFLLGSAWGALGYRRGWAMLHGSAVEIGGRAVLLSGDSGAGKSTLAAALSARGHRLLSDDLCRVESESGEAVLYPSTARIKLWGETLDHLGWRERVVQRDHFRDDKFHLSVQGSGNAEPVPLGAITLLEWGDASAERLRGGAGVRRLADSGMYRKPFLELLGRMADHMVHCARIAAKVPLYRLSRPRDLGALDSTCERIEELLAEG